MECLPGAACFRTALKSRICGSSAMMLSFDGHDVGGEVAVVAISRGLATVAFQEGFAGQLYVSERMGKSMSQKVDGAVQEGNAVDVSCRPPSRSGRRRRASISLWEASLRMMSSCSAKVVVGRHDSSAVAAEGRRFWCARRRRGRPVASNRLIASCLGCVHCDVVLWGIRMSPLVEGGKIRAELEPIVARRLAENCMNGSRLCSAIVERSSSFFAGWREGPPHQPGGQRRLMFKMKGLREKQFVRP